MQSKSLVGGDSSIVFSPPSIVAETLHDDTVFESKKSSVGQWNTKFQVGPSWQCSHTAIETCYDWYLVLADHLPGKPGKLRKFAPCPDNVRDWSGRESLVRENCSLSHHNVVA